MAATREAVARGYPSTASFTIKDGLLWHKGRLVLPSTSQHKQQVIHELHNTLVSGHSRNLRTYKRLLANFFWVQMKSNIKAFIQQCDTCQHNKYDTQTLAGLLQPLPIPYRVWEDISKDFIDGLPHSTGLSTIMVMVNRLSKYGHFVALKHPYLAKTIAEVFVKEITRLHGMPRSIASDRDLVFTSQFWEEYF